MADRTPVQTDAIVIRTFPYAEADLVVHILSASHGKMSLLAKAARKSKKRFASCPDIFDRGSFTFSKGRGSMPLLTEFTPRGSFRALREDIMKISTASLVCECVDFMVKEESEGHEAAFEALSAALTAIDEAPDQKAALRSGFSFVAKLLEISGFGTEQQPLQPGMHALLKMLERIEGIAERELKTKDSLISLVRTLL